MQSERGEHSKDFVLSHIKNVKSEECLLQSRNENLFIQYKNLSIYTYVEHLLSVLTCLDNHSSEEGYRNIVKATSDVQTSLSILGKGERKVVLSIFGSREYVLIPKLLYTIEICNEATVIGAICGLLHNFLVPNYDGNVRHQIILSLVRNNAVEKLFRSLKNFSSTSFSREEIGLAYGLHVIAKLASKDSKLAVKCRLIGGVKFTHQLLQVHGKNDQIISSLLLIMKFISKNSTNQVILGKDGCVATLISLLNVVPKNHWMKIRLIVENLAILIKTKSNVIRIVRGNGLVRILSLLENFEKIDARNQEKVIKSVISLLSHLCDSKHGCKAVISLKGDEVLHKFIIGFNLDQKLNYLLGIALSVFLKCTLKGELPVMSSKGAIYFKLPKIDSKALSESESREVSPDPGNYFSDEDEFEEECEEEEEENSRASDLSTLNNPQTTNLSDLMKFSTFFPEYQDFQPVVDISERKCTFVKENHELYMQLSSMTKSLINFVKIAYPDMVMSEGVSVLEPFYQRNSRVIREKALRTVDRVLHAEHYQEKVVYDLDYLLESEQTRQRITPTSPPARILSNWDEKRVGKKDITVNHLNFESRFESGNLRRAVQISKYEYDLVLNSDVNSWHHHQWFYFEVSNMEAGVSYIMNIINNEKPNSEFNFGMKPVMFSVKEALLGRVAWCRTGYDICYHKNHFARIPKHEDGSKFHKGSGKNYYTVSITVTFPHPNDVVYLAYHYPYTFTRLQAFLSKMECETTFSNIFYRNQVLCQTLNGNMLPLLTITSKDVSSKDKEVIFLTARVHPGESNSSWVIQGTIQFLLGSSDEAKSLRDKFVFKIVPMLNPEGVIHGNQRCGLTDEDLNRRWKYPNPVNHPTIYHTKGLIEYLSSVVKKPPHLFCDFHGHSRQKNIFMYGCSNELSWWHGDRDTAEDNSYMILPHIAQQYMKTFSFDDCRFDVEKAKESTARVVVWRQFEVKNSYTIEASTCGCDQGPYKNFHLNPKLLLESGGEFCSALYHFGCCNITVSPRPVFKRRNWTDSNFSESFAGEGEDEDHGDSEDDLDLELYGSSLTTLKSHD